jgi:hypothetical protein
VKQLVAIAVSLGAILAFWKRKEVSQVVKAAVGIIDTPPSDLAAADGVDVEVESLARVGQSEESSTAGRTAVMWACKNMAAKRGLTITALVTNAKHKEKHTDEDGKVTYGPNSITPDYHGLYTMDLVGKYCSTWRTPTQETLQLAKDILAGNIDDPTEGATKWDAPGLLSNADDIAARREQEGLRLVLIPGVDKTRFWA